jgi:hypothetical protein
MNIASLDTLGHQCSEIFTKKPAETTVPVFFRILNGSITIEHRPSRLLRFWRFITFRVGQNKFANCATKLQNLFTKESIAPAIKDQATLHNTFLLISATKQTIKRYESNRKALPKSVESLKISVDTFAQDLFNTLHSQAKSEEKKLLYRWAESHIKQEVKPENTLKLVSKVSGQLFFPPIQEENHQFSERMETALPLLEKIQQTELTNRYSKFQAAKKWKTDQPLESLINKKISRFKGHLETAEKVARKQFFDNFVKKANFIARSHYLNLSEEFQTICRQEKRACEEPFSLIEALFTIKQRLTDFYKKLDKAERSKIPVLKKQEASLRRRLTALETKGETRTKELLTTLTQPSNDFISIAKKVTVVASGLSLLKKDRLTSFLENQIQALKLTERCQDLEEKQHADAQSLIQELEEIQEKTTWANTEKKSRAAIKKAVKQFNNKLNMAEVERINEIITRIFGVSNLVSLQVFLQTHLAKMVGKIKKDPTKTQTAILNSLSTRLKVRYREGRVQALLSKEIGTGSSKTVYCVATLLGPKIHESVGSVYSYAKLLRIEAFRDMLKDIDQDLEDQPFTPRTRSKTEQGRERLNDYISLTVKEVSKEVQISQELPQGTGVQMYRINHEKRPDEIKGIVMEWFNEGNLETYRKNRLSKLGEYQQYLTKLQLAQKLCTCFAAMHDLGICHLDVKLEQFLVSKKIADGKRTIRLSDYGSAQRRGTILPEPIGTPIYTAPELLLDQAQKASPAMDCWSFGISLGELFYGPSFNKLNNSKDVRWITLNWANSRGEANYKLWCTLNQQMISSLPTVNEGNIIRGLLDPNPDSRWTAEQAGQAFARLVQA